VSVSGCKLIGFLVFLLLGISVTSCRKEKLEGDHAVLVGKWEWYHTYGSGSTNRPGAIDDTPEEKGITYEIEFIEKGKFVMWKNGEKTNKGRITYINDNIIEVEGNEFHLTLLFCQMDTGTICIGNWPTNFPNTVNYFSRIE